MKIVVLHHEPSRRSADDLDVLVQRDAIAQALQSLGHQPVPVSCGMNLEKTAHRLRELEPDLAFNLVESLDGTDRLAPVATLLLDALRVPYTGCPSEAILTTGDKIRAKTELVAHALPTPSWWAHGKHYRAAPSDSDNATDGITGRYIIKAVGEHASLGLEDDAILRITSRWQIEREVRERSARLGVPCFAEQFVDGREFNLSLLEGEAGVSVLPPAEIDFSAFDAARPRIVGYRAKWAPDSFEYNRTPRRFDFSPQDQPLLDELSRLALRCWEIFRLGGYARVDFRVDSLGMPWILEVNTNPCLSPDAGFAAAAERQGLSYAEMVGQIVNAALSVQAVRN